MKPKVLLVIAGLWFAAVIAWTNMSGSFLLPLGTGRKAKLAAISLIYAYQVVVYGWIIPLVAGLYLLFRKH